MNRAKLFKKPKFAVSIETPKKFKQRIQDLKSGGLTKEEFQSIRIAKLRAKLQLRRKNLSKSEKKQFQSIAKTKLPKITK